MIDVGKLMYRHGVLSAALNLLAPDAAVTVEVAILGRATHHSELMARGVVVAWFVREVVLVDLLIRIVRQHHPHSVQSAVKGFTVGLYSKPQKGEAGRRCHFLISPCSQNSFAYQTAARIVLACAWQC
jgi:hypothetical protein